MAGVSQLSSLFNVADSNSHHNQGSAAHTRIKQTSQRIQSPATSNRPSGFTIVELLIVIVVVAVLAAISYVGYTSITERAITSTLKSDLTQAAKQLAIDQVNDGTYPSGSTLPSNIKASDGNTLQYTSDGTSFCLSVTSSRSTTLSFHINNSTGSTTPQEGVCSGHSGPSTGGGSETIADGALMQTITSTNCPTTRTRAVDARDSRTYWIQKIGTGADARCWMLTNLAYAGGGTNTYSDTIPTTTLTNGTGGSATYTAPQYYIPTTGSNPTTEPTDPSTSTAGTGQYGYLYNWCAAMGAQTTTSACANATTPAPSTTTSICPANWRLPIGNGGEFTLLNNAINGGATTTDQGLRSEWLAQRSGYWYNGFSYQGSGGYYWSSTQVSAANAHSLYFNSTYVNPAGNVNKTYGFAVRCVAV